MSSEPAIRVEGLGKAYTIRHNQSDHVTLAQVALERAKHPFRRSEREQFWALQDVSFEVRQGEVLGVIGRNGAGKSTLLKLLTRITEPTAGRIELWGRVGSLLEVGTGFHPELTGRENVYLNGSILGMSRKEIDRQFDAIVDFAGIEKFLDTPVKRYSSGMYVRLAFAVAAHLETEVLLVDEVLAVGDQEFQKRCLGKMRDVATAGRTVLLVSHQMGAIRSLCERAVVLDRGRIGGIGPADWAIGSYTSLPRPSPDSTNHSTRRQGTGEVRISRVTVSTEPLSCAEPVSVSVDFSDRSSQDFPFFVGVLLRDSEGTPLVHLDTRVHDQWFRASDRQVELTLRTPWLKPGRYVADVFLCADGVIDGFERACAFEVMGDLPYPHFAPADAWQRGEVLADFEARRGPGARAEPEASSTDVTHDAASGEQDHDAGSCGAA